MTATGRAQHAADPDPRCILLAALAALGAADGARGAASCVDARSRPLQAIEAVRVVALGFPRALAPAVERAMAMWNAPACNDGGFPFFRAATDAPHRVLEVSWVRGTNPAVAGSCGSFVGNRIALYSHARDPRDGAVRPCGGAAQVAETLAHELGHALGLVDQYDDDCAGYIMSQMVRRRTGQALARRVRAEECAAVDRWFLTAVERGGRPEAELLAAAPAAVDAGLRPPAGAAGFLPRSARTAPGSPATASDGFRP